MRKTWLFNGLISLVVLFLFSAGIAFAEAPIVKLTGVNFVHGDEPTIQVSIKNLSASQAVMAKVQGVFLREDGGDPDITVSRSFKLQPNTSKDASLPLLIDPQHNGLKIQVVDVTTIFDEETFTPEEFSAPAQ